MANIVQAKRGTTSQWSNSLNNTTLSPGQIGVEYTSTGATRLKVGSESESHLPVPWESLEYIAPDTDIYQDNKIKASESFSIESSGDLNIKWGEKQVVLAGSSIIPVSDGISIGDSTDRFKDLSLSGTANTSKDLSDSASFRNILILDKYKKTEILTSIVAGRTDASACSVGTHIYLVGGSSNENNTGYSNKLQIFNPDNPVLDTVITLSEGVRNTAMVPVGKNLYIFGGRTSVEDSDKIYKFDSEAADWVSLPSECKLPQKLSGISAAAVGTDIYLFGGQHLTVTSRKIYKFSTLDNSITTLSAEIPYPLSRTSAVSIGTSIYIFGGISYSEGVVSHCSKIIYEFDTLSETLKVYPVEMASPCESPLVTTIGNSIYILGGFNSLTNESVSDIYRLNLSNVSLTKLSSTSLYRRDASIASIGTNIYCLGGDGVSTVSKISLVNPSESPEYSSLPAGSLIMMRE